MTKIGAHVSAAISLERSFDKALEIGASCIQIFISPPQQWFQAKHSDLEIERFVKRQSETKIGPNFIHGTYLINLGTQNPENLQKAVDWLAYALNTAGRLGMEGVIFHTGSHKGAGFDAVSTQISESIKRILAKSPANVNLILETAAGAGNIIGDKFCELGQILRVVNDPRLKICLDTCHVFAAGYDIKTSAGLKNTLTEFDMEVGLKNLVAIHANDSKFPLGSGKDRHANIGEGFISRSDSGSKATIGKGGFENIINHPKLKNLPFILEVPGFNQTGPDKENIILLQSLVK